MFPKHRRYKFDTETLHFVEVKKSAGKKLIRCLTFVIGINLFAFILLGAIHLFIDSPEVQIQQLLVKKYNDRYEELSEKLDSLSLQLVTQHTNNDQLYRNILEMDSLPKSYYSAGTGGYDPYAVPMNNYANQPFSSLKSKLSNINLQVKIQDQSYAEILKAALDKNHQLEHFPGITPVKCSEEIHISSYFGSRDDPFTLFLKMHSGIDFQGPVNTPVYATANGIVTLAKYSRTGYGNEIVIDHGYGYTTRYAHLNEILVNEGQKIKRAEQIGKMGSSGRSTGTHVHYEVCYQNEPINPLYFFADDLTPEEFEKLAERTTD